MDWIQVSTIVGVNIALIAAMATLIVWSVNKLDGDVNSIRSDLKSLGSRLDGHASRIDTLYKMFCELNESSNKKWNDLLEKFYKDKK
jgi:hypothetical protein